MPVPIEYEHSSAKKSDLQMSLKTQNGEFLEKYIGGILRKIVLCVLEAHMQNFDLC
jgi:hypothetical protein